MVTGVHGVPKVMRNRPRTPGGRGNNGSLQTAVRPMGRHRSFRPLIDLPIKSEGLPGLRSTIAAWADKFGAGERGEDIVLVAHELATNVVRHGGGTGRLRLWWEGQRVVCRVSDDGPGIGVELCDPSPCVPGGRGLWIARRLADVRIQTGPAGTVVTAGLSV